MRASSIRKSDGPSAQHPVVVLPSRPFPVQAKKKSSAPTTIDEVEQETQTAQARPRSGGSFGDISVLPRQSTPAGGSAALPGPLRQKLERAFNTDFSDVRVHPNTPDADSLSALAFTQGRDIHFAPGQYNPASQQGQKIIAHELAHVVQQWRGRVPAPQSQDVPINADPGLEAEADRVGTRAASGAPVSEISGNSLEGLESSPGKIAPVQPTMVDTGGASGGAGGGGGKQPVLCPYCGGPHTADHCPKIGGGEKSLRIPPKHVTGKPKVRGRRGRGRAGQVATQSSERVLRRARRYIESGRATHLGTASNDEQFAVPRKASEGAPRTFNVHRGGGGGDALDMYEGASADSVPNAQFEYPDTDSEPETDDETEL